MLSISPPISGTRGDYYIRLSREDYYNAEGTGKWHGRAANDFGLDGDVEDRVFKSLLLGLSPLGGEALVQNAGSSKRQQGWDLTFSAPKCVSVLWALAAPEVRTTIEDIQKRAVAAALWFLEDTAAVTRRGHEGKIKEPANLLFALFTHFTSRALDPQLHTHAVLLNLCARKDGTTGAIQSKDVFKRKMETGQIYRRNLAGMLRDRLGAKVTSDRNGFRIDGISDSLCKQFSKRRSAIEARLRKTGERGAIAAKRASLSTRPKKLIVNPNALFAMWRSEANAQEINILHISEIHPNFRANQCADSTLKIASKTKMKGKPFWKWGMKKRSRKTIRWGRVHLEKDLFFADVFIQDKILFPSAPKWSPVHGKSLPSLRLKPKAPIEKWLPGFVTQSLKGRRMRIRGDNHFQHH